MSLCPPLDQSLAGPRFRPGPGIGFTRWPADPAM